MKHPNRPLLRLASRIRDRVLALGAPQTAGVRCDLSSLVHRIDQLRSFRRQLELCEQHGLNHAALCTCASLRYQLDDLGRDAAQLERSLPVSPDNSHPSLSLAEAVKDLEQLEEEFRAWEFDPVAQILSVKTHAIELEDIYLGPFEIQLHIDRLDHPRGRTTYQVIALDPHPARCNEHVTHPHVSDEVLCEGDATTALGAALREGRLCDFFMLVRSVLTTYNPESPYVKLEHWEGEACSDCGHLMSGDDRCLCESCDQDYCPDCVTQCYCCDETRCFGCLRECQFCEERVCSACLKVCEGCLEKCCRSCLQDGLCPECLERQEQEQEQLHDDNQPAGASNNAGDDTDDTSDSNTQPAGEGDPPDDRNHASAPAPASGGAPGQAPAADRAA